MDVRVLLAALATVVLVALSHASSDADQTIKIIGEFFSCVGWLGSRVVSVLDSGAEGPGLNRSRDAVG